MQIDPKIAFYFGVWTSILVLLGGSPDLLKNVLPDVWIVHVVAACLLFGKINNVLLTAALGFSSMKSGPLANLTMPVNPIVKPVIGFLIIGAAFILSSMPTQAMAQTPQAMGVPMPKAKLIKVAQATVATTKAAAPAAKPTTAPAATVNPLKFLISFGQTDVQNALDIATKQNNLVTKPCWTFILGQINGSQPSLLPNQLGLATFIETALDDQTVLANYFTPNGLYDQFTIACSPMITKVNATIVVGGAAVAVGIAGGPAANAALLKGLTLMLTGATALPALSKL